MHEQLRQRAIALDKLLFEICETLQLSPTQHQKAVDRYKAIAKVLDNPNTPFEHIASDLYPQGSMRLGTTVKPINGPHDLDFVCEFAVSHMRENPMVLLRNMHEVFKNHGVYGGMVELKKRCVRITYRDEFYLDILPACRDHFGGGTCIQVPDRELRCWTSSNPIGYAKWFEEAERGVIVSAPQFPREMAAMDKAASVQPIPTLQATEEKSVLQLIVQLLKRWRDVHYSVSKFPPISVVLTTLAGDVYQGEPLLCQSLLCVLDRIVAKLDEANSRGERLRVCNPSQGQEDFSERWDADPQGYYEFERGIRSFASAWRMICFGEGDPNQSLERLFGEVVNTAIVKGAQKLQGVRERQGLGITSTGRIAPIASAITPMLRNTNHGSE